jgi:CBS domain-containing protein
MMRVKDLLGKRVALPLPLVQCADSVETAIKTMRSLGTGAVIVLEGGDTVGILTERDLVQSKRLGAPYWDPCFVSVAEVMNANMISVNPDQALKDCLRVMQGHRIRQLPVMEDDFPIALLEIEDVLRELIDESSIDEELDSPLAENVNRIIHSYRPLPYPSRPRPLTH